MTMLRSVVLLVLGACVSSLYVSILPSKIRTDTAWAEYKSTFQKDFTEVKKEKTSYFAWKDTLTKITKHNAAYVRGKSTFKMGVNKYSDLTAAQYKTMLGLKVPSKDKICEPPLCGKDLSPLMSSRRRVARSIPDSIDWRDHGYVTRVKDQGYCGSCWTFGSTGSMEGQNFKKTGQLIELSEQNLLDCCGPIYDADGCNGGWLTSGYEYVIDNEGIDKPYVYEAKQGTCRFNRSTVVGTCQSFKQVNASEEALKEAVATVGPITVAIDAYFTSFKDYRSGVYNEPFCSHYPNHAVLVVGYGTYNGEKYWLIKNSWGTSWGMDGYFMMARDANNMCGVSLYAFYPIV